MTEAEQPEPARDPGQDAGAPDGVQDDLVRADAAATTDDDIDDAPRPDNVDVEREA
jgi:hypothetical protein